jgi:molybdate transport system regulatory protein
MARLTLRVDLGPGQAIGHGKVRLLEAIRDHGSISAAGRALGMSYKRAWDLVEDLSRCFREPVVEKRAGGQQGGGAALTPLGARVVAHYRAIEAAAHAAAAPHLRDLEAAVRHPEQAEAPAGNAKAATDAPPRLARSR